MANQQRLTPSTNDKQHIAELLGNAALLRLLSLRGQRDKADFNYAEWRSKTITSLNNADPVIAGNFSLVAEAEAERALELIVVQFTPKMAGQL